MCNTDDKVILKIRSEVDHKVLSIALEGTYKCVIQMIRLF